MALPSVQKIINYLIAMVWLVNGLFCKIFDLVPRHRAIVARILGPQHSLLITKAIGFFEILMCAWVLSGYKKKENAWTQIIIIAIMNIIEFVLAKDLLLWGRFNIFFAFLFILLIYLNSFVANKKA